MKIFVDAKPGARKVKLEKLDATHFKISVKEPAREGRANEAIRKALAENLDIAPSRLKLISGKTGKQKVFEV